MDEWLRQNLICPRDRQSLTLHDTTLICGQSHRYPIVDGIPVMLLDEATHTGGGYTETVGHVTRQSELPETASDLSEERIAPLVQEVIAATCGNLYKPLIGKLTRYPIPDLRLPDGDGQFLLDIGCNWGRWCVSAARKGYQPVGIDPSLTAIRAARHVAQQLNVATRYVVADARYLPFAPQSFDVAFSYSVLQHFYREDVLQTLAEVARVLRPGGTCLVQMPNCFGLWNLLVQLRQGFKEPGYFVARYWRPGTLERVFTERIGPSQLSVDGFFSLNPQVTDKELLPPPYRLVVNLSDFLRRVSRKLPALLYIADSLYVQATRGPEAVQA